MVDHPINKDGPPEQHGRPHRWYRALLAGERAVLNAPNIAERGAEHASEIERDPAKTAGFRADDRYSPPSTCFDIPLPCCGSLATFGYAGATRLACVCAGFDGAAHCVDRDLHPPLCAALPDAAKPAPLVEGDLRCGRDIGTFDGGHETPVRLLHEALELDRYTLWCIRIPRWNFALGVLREHCLPDRSRGWVAISGAT